MDNRELFQAWSLGYGGCDGGDLGSPEKPAIWACGIEWGGGHQPADLLKQMEENVSSQWNSSGYDGWEENINYRFNWQLMKLLSVIHGGYVSEYKQFAEEHQPFVQGKSGYFKMNLYPIAFKDTNDTRWQSGFLDITGFHQKSDYLAWCHEHRFPQMRQWAEVSQPKLIICLGKSYLPEFKMAFMEPDAVIHEEVIDEKVLYWGRNSQQSLVVVIPFMANRHGLNRNVSIQKFGEHIAALMQAA
ncbi:hypothetical protein ACIKP9_13260 [Methylobacillus methanolivorans]|uniref:Uracil-DNA glycosylase-like domain-containing protein n=1 Tax=Methylobacillus methanolivorans TaxID=1848927 RepID=A0ABW8GQ32_9PROT